MSHARTQIKQAIVNLLTSNIGTATIIQSRVYPLEDSKLPAILIYARQETITEMTLSKPRTQYRTLSLVLEGIVKANSNLDSTLDNLALQIEQVLAVNTTLSGLAKDIILKDTEIQYHDEGDKPYGTMILTYHISYAVIETAPQTII